MFVTLKKFKLEKGFGNKLSEGFLKKGIVENSKGFVKLEVLLNNNYQDYDLIIIKIYWESKEDFINFERSPEHLKSHKEKKIRPKEIIDVSFEMYEIIGMK